MSTSTKIGEKIQKGVIKHMNSNKKSTIRRDYGPARSPEAKENQLINMAFKLAEEKLKNGTASSQLITHFLKLATEKERLENEKVKAELELSKAKIKHMESQATSQELYEKALSAFRSYSGTNMEYDDSDE